MQYRTILVAILVLAACKPEVREKTPELFEALPGIPIPPASQLMGRAGSSDALQLSFRSEWTEADLLAYYRQLLAKAPWKLVGDVRDRDGAAVLYAERDGPPIWVRIHKAAGATGVAVEISGAVTGSSGPPARPSARDSVPADTSSGD